ncbi:MAG: hypothetical protein HYU97_00490 [Deltaproteobacteria bacterium]|nr:hypothetical protein [Deltaproteobacteria bacterium]
MKKIPDPTKLKKIARPILSKTDLAKAKVRITTYLDQDVLQSLQGMARQMGGKYQSILNQLLRNTLFGKPVGILTRIEKLEKAVFKKVA